MTFLLLLIIGITIMVLFAVYNPYDRSRRPKKKPKEIMKEAQLPFHKLPKREQADLINEINCDLGRVRKKFKKKD